MGTPGEWTGPGHGHLSVNGDEVIVFDPPAMTGDDSGRLERLGEPAAVPLTSDWHVRAAPTIAARYDVPIYAHSETAPHCDCDVDGTFAPGDELPGGWRAVAIPIEGASKFHGVTVFHHGSNGGVLVSGDAILAHEDGTVVARDAGHLEGLRRLLDYEFHAILTGHGPAIL